MTQPKVLRFGIQSLDKLIGTIKDAHKDIYGIDLSEPEITEDRRRSGPECSQPGAEVEVDDESILPLTSSVCLTGPDGTGKSVLSLHLASQYLADCLADGDGPVAREAVGRRPRVLYISTDLTYKMALKGWNHFALENPLQRREPLVELKDGRRQTSKEPGLVIKLNQYFPSTDSLSSKSIVNYLQTRDDANPTAAEVCFVDLASRTAGDDWGFLHRLVSTMEAPDDPQSPRHLVILDAVEGFETLVGDLNAFGEKSSRRSRIAQVMRLAAGKCHLVFVIEEARDERFPEEFVTDVVIRLRNIRLDRYLRRTIEVEKTRGQWHIRGQHPYVIRDGKGSTTGIQHNADEPEIRKAYDLFREGDFVNPENLIRKLKGAQDPVEDPVSAHLHQLLKPGKPNQKNQSPLKELVEELNELLKNPSLYDEEPFKKVPLSAGTEHLRAARSRNIEEQMRFNRRLLEDAYPTEIVKNYQSYVHVFPSLNYQSREIMIDKYNPRKDSRRDLLAAFGITYLDNMLGGRGQKAEIGRKNCDTRGLPCGTATALIGDSLTQKSQLGKAFLSRAFFPYASLLAKQINQVANSAAANCKPAVIEKLGQATGEGVKGVVDWMVREVVVAVKERMDGILKELNETLGQPSPVVVMFTTHDVNHVDLANEFYAKWLKDVATDFGRDHFLRNERMVQHRQHFMDSYRKALREALSEIVEEELKTHIKEHAICRRFEIHDIPAPILMHIFQRNIEKAQRIMVGLREDQELPEAKTLFQESWRIRVVIDDLNGFRNMFPEVRDDPLMLPSLLFMLRREGVTSLIIDTQTSGSPELSITERFDSSVRELVEHRIYTWRLPFYGENRVAISLIPPISHQYRGVIRELRWETKGESKEDRSLMVDPHFELYMGMQRTQPQPVPLNVRLYAETPNIKKYIESEERVFRELFTPVLSPLTREDPHVISWAEVTDYDALRDSSRLQRDTRMDHTTLLQVDEFWWLRRATQRRAGAFRQQWNYLSAVTATRVGEEQFEPETAADPFGVFQPPSQAKANETRRLDFFDDQCGYNFKNIRANEAERIKRESEGGADTEVTAEQEEQYIDRVPFTWDFGFLLCNGKAWEEAFDLCIGPEAFRASDFKDAPALITKLTSKKRDPISKYLFHSFDDATLKLLEQYKRQTKKQGEVIKQLTNAFNELLTDRNLYDELRFRDVKLSEETRKLLNEAADEKDSTRHNQHLNRLLLLDAYQKELHKRTVRQVWERLSKVNQKPEPGSPPVSWREFLAASKVVAEFQSYRTSTRATAFDFTMLSPEAFSCLILEMWVSEIYVSLSRRISKCEKEISRPDLDPILKNQLENQKDHLAKTRKSIVERVSQRRWYWEDTGNYKLEPKALLVALENERDEDLAKTLDRIMGKPRSPAGTSDSDEAFLPRGGYSLELYKVWLLLIEALDFADLVDSSSHLNFEFRSRDVGHQAVSARHWYKTASKFVDSLTPEQLEYNWVPVRLPGHFSVRSDWFLAVVGGSRSSRLADNALDLLSSQRANVTRLQEGIGLPTRELFDQNSKSRLRTRLISVSKKREPLASVEYEELRKLGALQNEDPQDFYWLWRSGIWAYNRYSRIWHKWLNRTLLKWHSWRQRYGSNWTSGFDVYDLITEAEFGEAALAKESRSKLDKLDLESWKHFHEMRDILIAELERVSISTT